MDLVIGLIALTLMEIVLGIDNIVFITILSGKLPKDQQAKARNIGLAAAMITRVLLLFSITWVMSLDDPLFSLSFLPEAWLPDEPEHAVEVREISWRDIILLGGGLFLIWKSVHEIHLKLEGHEEQHKARPASFASVIAQIAVLDIVFSLDSVITAVGMIDATGDARAQAIGVMVTAIVIAIGVMLAFSGPVSAFVTRHPTVKMLALSFLILIGVLLVAEGSGAHFNKGYVYFAMAFSLVVEMLNLRIRPHVPHAEQTLPTPPSAAE